MANYQQYFAAIAAEKRELDARCPAGFVRIISLANLAKNVTAGSPSEVTTAMAARFVTDQTHRLMTAEEVSTFELSEAERRKLIAKDDGAAIKRRVRSMLGDNR